MSRPEGKTIIGYTLGNLDSPVFSTTRGELSMKAFLFCGNCGETISNVNGPTSSIWCVKCSNADIEVSEPLNVPELALTPYKHRVLAAEVLMDWMESNRMDHRRAADVIGVSTHLIVSIINTTAINNRLFKKIANKVPGLLEHIRGAN